MVQSPHSETMHQPMKLLRHIFQFAILIGFLTACGSAPPPTPTPTATLRPTATATPRPTPTVTPVPLCPATNLAAEWAAPDQFDGYPEAIRAYLAQGGTAANLLTILRNASSINEKWGSVSSIDLTGDGEPEIVVSIFDPFTADQSAGPSGQLLVYGCAPQRVDLLYANQATKGQIAAAPLAERQSHRCAARRAVGRRLIVLRRQHLLRQFGSAGLERHRADKSAGRTVGLACGAVSAGTGRRRQCAGDSGAARPARVDRGRAAAHRERSCGTGMARNT